MLDLDKLCQAIGYQVKNEELLKQALCHKSFSKENSEWLHNEKLEFLGDAVLDVIISDLLMKKYKDDQEGSLSRKRASIVNEDRLFQLGTERNLPEFILLGTSEKGNRLFENPRIVASAFEAVVGAIYRDAGFDAAFEWVEGVFSDLIDQAFSEHDFAQDYKTRFQEWAQEKHKTTPKYKVVGQEGPDHARVFFMEVYLNDELWG
ncbi:MAG: ribonuclease III, partial [Bdellovibrionales bacterium]|nr:ribonuclease III [Bdellovibrionales bacterium]